MKQYGFPTAINQPFCLGGGWCYDASWLRLRISETSLVRLACLLAYLF